MTGRVGASMVPGRVRDGARRSVAEWRGGSDVVQPRESIVVRLPPVVLAAAAQLAWRNSQPDHGPLRERALEGRVHIKYARARRISNSCEVCMKYSMSIVSPDR